MPPCCDFKNVKSGSSFAPFTSILANCGKVMPYLELQKSVISSSLPGAWFPNWLHGKSKISNPCFWYFSFLFYLLFFWFFTFTFLFCFRYFAFVILYLFSMHARLLAIKLRAIHFIFRLCAIYFCLSTIIYNLFIHELTITLIYATTGYISPPFALYTPPSFHKSSKTTLLLHFRRKKGYIRNEISHIPHWQWFSVL